MDENLIKSLRKSQRKGKYERSESGLYFASERATFGGEFFHSVNGGDVVVQPNTMVNEAGNYFLDVALAAGSQLSAFYMTMFKGNVTPAVSWTAATFDSTATEVTGTDIAETTRQVWTPGAVSTLQVDNYSSKAAMTVDTATLAVYGLAMLSSNVLGGTTGTLIAATRFAAVRNLVLADVLNMGYRFTVTL